MKVIICDVGDAACAFVTSTNGHTMMIDCGSNEHKENPVTVFNRYKRWLGTKEYSTVYIRSAVIICTSKKPIRINRFV